MVVSKNLTIPIKFLNFNNSLYVSELRTLIIMIINAWFVIA